MKQMVAYMNHPLLQWVVVVKPEGLDLDTNSLPIEEEGKMRLKNVSSLREALDYVRETATAVDWSLANMAFFPNYE